jgi:transcriptional regulator with XRE-family HTH domain
MDYAYLHYTTSLNISYYALWIVPISRWKFDTFQRVHMADERKKIGRQIKTLRQARDMSQEELSEKVSINSKYLSAIERGKANPTLDIFTRLAEALNVSLPDLFDYELEPKELAQLVAGLIAEGDEIKLRLAAKVLNSICR